MSFLVNILCKGNSQPTGRFANWLGRKLALRNKNVTLGRDVHISPGALICPRKDAIEIGDDCRISNGAMIQGNVRIGHHSSVQNYTNIVGYGADGMVRIGNYVRIAAHCMIIGANHNFADPGKPINQQGLTPKSIVIEDDVWIGGSVNIVAGVTIGRGSVIGAGSVVTKDIPPMSIAVGAPAKVIKKRV